MARDIQINGETLVSVKGGPGSGFPSTTELGLSAGTIDIHPVFFFEPALTDDFGNKVGADWMTFLAWFEITMQLVHFDEQILEFCIAESMAAPQEGQVAGAGTLLGRGDPAKGHYISLNLSSPVGQNPWHFPNTFLSAPPFVYPLGTERSLVGLNWRAVPYVLPGGQTTGGSGSVGDGEEGGKESGLEFTSAGAVLFDHTLDT